MLKGLCAAMSATMMMGICSVGVAAAYEASVEIGEVTFENVTDEYEEDKLLIKAIATVQEAEASGKKPVLGVFDKDGLLAVAMDDDSGKFELTIDKPATPEDDDLVLKAFLFDSNENIKPIGESDELELSDRLKLKKYLDDNLGEVNSKLVFDDDNNGSTPSKQFAQLIVDEFRSDGADIGVEILIGDTPNETVDTALTTTIGLVKDYTDIKEYIISEAPVQDVENYKDTKFNNANPPSSGVIANAVRKVLVEGVPMANLSMAEFIAAMKNTGEGGTNIAYVTAIFQDNSTYEFRFTFYHFLERHLKEEIPKVNGELGGVEVGIALADFGARRAKVNVTIPDTIAVEEFEDVAEELLDLISGYSTSISYEVMDDAGSGEDEFYTRDGNGDNEAVIEAFKVALDIEGGGNVELDSRDTVTVRMYSENYGGNKHDTANYSGAFYIVDFYFSQPQ